MLIDISISNQLLVLLDDSGKALMSFPVSSAEKGVGCRKGSFQTPCGRHIVRAKIGGNCPINTVFVGRRPTGEIYSPELARQHPQRDWILSRILWLSGCEPGVNRLADVDTMQRYIYIHGTPDSEPMGVPASHGCIRMRNADILHLYAAVPVGTTVMIHAQDD